MSWDFCLQQCTEENNWWAVQFLSGHHGSISLLNSKQSNIFVPGCYRFVVIGVTGLHGKSQPGKVLKPGLTSVSDATQVVEDVVECRIGLLTCLGNQQWGLNVYDTAQFSVCVSKQELRFLLCVSVWFRYHNENSENSQAVPLRHGCGHVGVELRVVVHHMQLERGGGGGGGMLLERTGGGRRDAVCKL